METAMTDLVENKIAIYMRVVKFLRKDEQAFYRDATAVKAFENLKKHLPEMLSYLSDDELKLVQQNYNDDLNFLKDVVRIN